MLEYIEPNCFATNFNCFNNSSNLGASLNLIVLIKDSLNLEAKILPASISNKESPMQMIFVTNFSSKSLIKSENACIFHWRKLSGNSFSYSPRAEIIFIFFNKSEIEG